MYIISIINIILLISHFNVCFKLCVLLIIITQEHSGRESERARERERRERCGEDRNEKERRAWKNFQKRKKSYRCCFFQHFAGRNASPKYQQPTLTNKPISILFLSALRLPKCEVKIPAVDIDKFSQECASRNNWLLHCCFVVTWP